jgi:hypothetical protein
MTSGTIHDQSRLTGFFEFTLLAPGGGPDLPVSNAGRCHLLKHCLIFIQRRQFDDVQFAAARSGGGAKSGSSSGGLSSPLLKS